MKTILIKRNIEKNKKKINIFATFFLIILILLTQIPNSEAAINKQINYQGKLTLASGVAVTNGTYNMEFKLYDSGSGTLWTETRTGANRVQVTNGLFSVMLGEVTALTSVDFNQTIFLGVNIGGTSVSPSWDGEMSPLKKLGAVPAAIEAEKAIKSTNLTGGNSTTLLGALPYQSGIDTTTLLSPNTTTIKKFLRMTGTGTNGAVPVWDTLLDADIPSALTGKTYNAISLTALSTGFSIAGGTTSKTLTVSNTLTLAGTDGSTLNIGTGGTLGTNAYTSTAFVPYIGATGNVTLGTYSLTSLLILGGTGTTQDLSFQTTSGVGATGADMHFLVGSNGGTEAMTILNNGNVGVGTTSPAGQLSVVRAAGDNLIYADNYSTTGGNSNYWFSRRSHSNTAGTLATTLTGDYQGVFYFQGVNSSNVFAYGSEIVSQQNGTAGTYVPTDLKFNTYSATAKNSNQLVLYNNGNVGIGTTSPTALLHIKAGTATAGTAPLKLTSGVNLSTTEAGAVEYDGSHLYFTATNGGTRYQLDQQTTGATPWDTIGDPSGNGAIAFGSTVQTMDWATATTTNPLSLNAQALTTGKLLSLNSNTLTSGTLLDITSAGTGALTNQKGLNVALSGVSTTASQTTYGAYISNTHGGTTSTNIGLYATASGADTNYAAQFEGGTYTGHILHVSNINSTSYIPIAGFFAPNNTTAGNASQLRFGVAPSYGNSAEWRFVYQGSGSASNRTDFGYYGYAAPVISYTVGGAVGIKNISPSALLTLGTAGTTAGTLSLAGLTSGTTTIAVPSTAGTYTLTLPPDAGTNTYVLQTNGSGVTSWVPQGGGSMIYPSAGIANSTGSAWGTSYTTTGSGSVLALATSPSFLTDITTPIILGGTSTTQDLSFQTTSGVGATGADMHFLVGSNGGTEAMTILNIGNVGIGVPNPGEKLDVAGNINFPTTTSTTGIIKQNGTNILHTYGTQNLFVGYDSGNYTLTGQQNTGIGYQVMGALTTGSYNTAVGQQALFNGNTSENAAFGRMSLMYATGSYNSGLGNTSLGGSSFSGNYNVGIGKDAGRTLSSGSTNTFIGYAAGYNASQLATATNSMGLGNGAYTTASNQVVIGNTNITQTLLNGSVGIKNTSPGALLTLGTAGTTAGTLSLAGLTSGVVTIDVPATVTTPYTLTLPAIPGTSGYVLSTNGSGTTSWIANGSGGGMSIGGAITSATEGSILFAGAGGVLAQNNTRLNWNDGTTLLTLGGDLMLNTQTDVRFGDSDSSNWVAFEAPATVASNVTWTLPSADASGCFKSNGSGEMSIGSCGDTNVQTFSSNGNYVVPTDALMVIVESWGGGGGGGGGYGTASAAIRSGGAGGGGGAYIQSTISASQLGSAGTNIPVTIGAGGTAGSSTPGTNQDGGAGGRTCLSSTTNCAGSVYVSVYGGGGGNGGSGTAGSGGGGGGGTMSVGATSTTQATGGTGGNPLGSAVNASNSGSGGGGGRTAAASASLFGGAAQFGGGGGGGSYSTGAGNSGTGGGSYKGGAGGGAGGSSAATYTLRTGGAGGSTFAINGGGGTSGTTNAQAGGNGSNGTVSGGAGGGGGATSNTTAGGNGGNGGIPAGGGGGGGASSLASGSAGGAGGGGYLRALTLRGSGADLAEVYGSNDDTITAGDVVALDKTMNAGVQKSIKAYDKDTIGVVSTSPGLTIGGVEDPGATPVLVALSGRVPVKVNMENGPIKKGDYLTASSVPGVAMKATKAGTIIGQAMTEYTDEEIPGYVVAFIKSGPSNGITIKEIIPGLTLDVEGLNNSLEEIVVTEDNDEELIDENDEENLEEELITPTETIQKMALNYFLANKIELEQAIDISEIYTDRLSAALEIITPTVITDTLTVNSIIVSTGEIVSFNSPTYFTIPPLFNNDTAGFAIIKEGENSVDVVYSEPYIGEPVVNASIAFNIIDDMNLASIGSLFDDDIKNMIVNSSESGFTILINKEAPRNIRFSWTALSVKDPKIFESVIDGLVFEEPEPEEEDPPDETVNNDQLTQENNIDNSETNEEIEEEINNEEAIIQDQGNTEIIEEIEINEILDEVIGESNSESIDVENIETYENIPTETTDEILTN